MLLACIIKYNKAIRCMHEIRREYVLVTFNNLLNHIYNFQQKLYVCSCQ